MSKGNAFENDWLLLIFNAVAIANLADNAASGPLTNVFLSLHVGTPGEAGDQTTAEATYTNYARVPVLRTAGGWTVTDNNAVNAAEIAFGAATGGDNEISHFGVGTNGTTGAGVLLYYGALTANLNVSAGITPSFAAGQLDIGED